jgi:hypothetical protein
MSTPQILPVAQVPYAQNLPSYTPAQSQSLTQFANAYNQQFGNIIALSKDPQGKVSGIDINLETGQRPRSYSAAEALRYEYGSQALLQFQNTLEYKQGKGYDVEENVKRAREFLKQAEDVKSLADRKINPSLKGYDTQRARLSQAMGGINAYVNQNSVLRNALPPSDKNFKIDAQGGVLEGSLSPQFTPLSNAPEQVEIARVSKVLSNNKDPKIKTIGLDLAITLRANDQLNQIFADQVSSLKVLNQPIQLSGYTSSDIAKAQRAAEKLNGLTKAIGDAQQLIDNIKLTK